MTTKQVRFWNKDDKKWLGGIMIDSRYIICGCCGSVFDCDKLSEEDIEPYREWVDISNEILGDQGLTKTLNRCIMILE